MKEKHTALSLSAWCNSSQEIWTALDIQLESNDEFLTNRPYHKTLDLSSTTL